jgi:hypothetical protein
MTQTSPKNKAGQGDEHKGAVESNRTNPVSSESQNGSMAGQLGHRDQDEEIKDNDTDFPEPDAEAEHSGGSR